MSGPYHQLNIFLNRYRITKDQKELATHLALPLPGKHRAGRFQIPDDKVEELYDILSRIDGPTSISENHLPDSCPIIIDLDFRKENVSPKEASTIISHVGNITSLIMQHFIDRLIGSILSKYIKDADQLEVIVMYKKVNQSDLNSHSGLFKYGVHIIFPETSLPYSILHLIRNDAINDPFIINLFKNDLKLDNSMEDIYDHAVIEKNSWMLYGSSKPGSSPYTKICLTKYNSISFRTLCHQNNNKLYSIRRFSIRRKRSPTPLKISIEEAEKLYQEIKKIPPISLVKQNYDLKNSTSIKDFIRLGSVGQLAGYLAVNCLSLTRADQYNLWVDLALCLSSISPYLRGAFIMFSKKSYKYVDEADCDKVWNRTPKMNPWEAFDLLMTWVKMDN